MGLIEQEKFKRGRADGSGSVDSSGRYQEASRVWTQFSDGNFQSIAEDDVSTLPEGERKRVEYAVFTSVDLRGEDQYAGKPGDLVEYPIDGEVFEVRKATDEGSLLGDDKFILLRVQED